MYLLTLTTIGLQNLFFSKFEFQHLDCFFWFWLLAFFLYPQCTTNSAFSTAPPLLFHLSDALSLVSGSLMLILICNLSCYTGIQSQCLICDLTAQIPGGYHLSHQTSSRTSTFLLMWTSTHSNFETLSFPFIPFLIIFPLHYLIFWSFIH